MLSKNRVIILVNLGSPDNLSKKSIRRFLIKFLSDKRVVGLPHLIWYPILYLFILPFRVPKLLIKYSKIWKQNCSPLIYYTKRQAELLQDFSSSDANTTIRYAFSYSYPTVNDVLNDLLSKNKLKQQNSCEIKSIQFIPLYPQFSSTTMMPIFDSIGKYFRDKKSMPSISIIRGFADNPYYIVAVVQKIKESMMKHGFSGKLIFSYHSLPVSLIEAGDSYFAECMLTTRLIVKELGLKEHEFIITFQSRFGANKWLSPSTIDTLRQLATTGTTSIDIVCPGFVSDCLETLEEIAITNKEAFIKHGGKHYNYISCLNDDTSLIVALNSLINNI